MASIINKISCNTANSNTGTPQCSFDFKDIVGFILVPTGTGFTEAQLTTFYATLQSGSKLDLETARYYPIQDLDGIEAKNVDPTTNTSTNGTLSFGRNGKLHWQFEYTKGGMNRENQLRTFQGNGSAYDVLLIEKSANAIIGTQADLNTSGIVMRGFTLDEIWCPLPQIGETPKHYINLAFADVTEMVERLAYRVLPSTQRVTNIKGLRNLEFSVYSFVGSVLKLNVSTDFGAIDLYDSFAAQLVALSANWSVVNAAGAAITTAYAIEAATKTITLTFSSTPWTTMVAGDLVVVNSPAISNMNATVPNFGNTTLNVFKP